MKITFQGKPVTLCGAPLKTGDRMPGFTLTGAGLEEVRETDLSGVCVYLTVPSLDTGVCDQEVRRFQQEAAGFPGVTFCAVSLDLPFAQARWCGAAGVDRVRVLSDYKDHSFGKATGTRMEELGLLTRAVLIADRDGRLAYAEYVPEITQHPDYEAALACLRELAGE